MASPAVSKQAPSTAPAQATQKRSVANPTYAVLPKQKYYNTFDDFYPFYLGEHAHPVNRRLHLTGTTISAVCATRALAALLSSATTAAALALPYSPTSSAGYDGAVAALRRFAKGLQDRVGLSTGATAAVLLGGVIQGYAFAWVGHFVFEKNKPATFTHPLWSFVGDLKMAGEVWIGRRRP